MVLPPLATKSTVLVVVGATANDTIFAPSPAAVAASCTKLHSGPGVEQAKSTTVAPILPALSRLETENRSETDAAAAAAGRIAGILILRTDAPTFVAAQTT